MSYNNKKNSNTGNILPNVLEFTVTGNIEKLEIKKFVLQGKDFLITWFDERHSCIGLKSSSLTQTIKNIEKILKKEKDKVDNDIFDRAIKDIEDQLIVKKDEIYVLDKTNSVTEKDSNDDLKIKFLEDVSNSREQFEKSTDPYKKWQSAVQKKYTDLQKIIIKYYPEAWPLMEFCLAVKSIQNIHDNPLPFIGIILAKPSSLKTTIIEFFRKYPGTFYSDSFTPNSMISHNSALSEQELQKIDMLPKLNNKFVLIPELAPIFTANEDDLQKILGLITRTS